MADNYINLPVEGGGGGGGAVTSVNGATGAINILPGTGIDVTTFGTNITVSMEAITGAANTLAFFNSSSELDSLPGFTQDLITGGLSEFFVKEPDDDNATFNVNSFQINFEPLQDSPNDRYNLQNISVRMDNQSSGFTQGTNGVAVTLQGFDITHQGTGDVGNLQIIASNFTLGNGTDPITINGLGYMFGFGTVNSNVTLTGGLQGYGFQPSINASATLNTYVQGFYDNANISTSSTQGHTSFSSSPTLALIPNGTGYTGFQSSANITSMQGYGQSVGIYPTIGTVVANAGFSGVNVSPTVTDNRSNVDGINVNMDNVTNYAGVSASLVVQDITYTIINPGADGNNITVEYLNTVTAGNEVATLVGGQHIQVTIESGVSTATQVRNALLANPTLVANATFPITGTASNPQVTYAETNLAGGINPGTKKAAYFKGDVQIDGALSFTGGLSIGALSSFANIDISGFSSGVNSIDTLITSPTTPANTVLTTDLLAVNTAMLLTIGDNSTLTSSFLGYTALGLPAVASLGINSTIDLVCGAAFALSLDGTAGAGSSIDQVVLCRALAIPNGITAVTRLSGFKMDLPFGDPGTTTFGVNITPAAHNYMAGDLVVGGTPTSDDTPTNSSVAIEIKSTVKAFLPSRMTTAERNALTAVNGMVLYNTTTDKLQVYAAGSWVDLH